MRKYHHDIIQGTDEWFAIRIGKATASNFDTIMANSISKKDGEEIFNAKAPFGDPAKKYAMKIAVESVTGKKILTFKNEFMERGNELEPEARILYEEEKFVIVNQCGFVEFGNYGASPDGLIEKNGMDCKSVLYNVHFKNMEKGFDTSYKWQFQGSIWICEADWWDFVSYCPDMPSSNRLHTFRVMRDDEMIERLQSRLEVFWELVKKYKELIK